MTAAHIFLLAMFADFWACIGVLMFIAGATRKPWPQMNIYPCYVHRRDLLR